MFVKTHSLSSSCERSSLFWTILIFILHAIFISPPMLINLLFSSEEWTNCINCRKDHDHERTPTVSPFPVELKNPRVVWSSSLPVQCNDFPGLTWEISTSNSVTCNTRQMVITSKTRLTVLQQWWRLCLISILSSFKCNGLHIRLDTQCSDVSSSPPSSCWEHRS